MEDFWNIIGLITGSMVIFLIVVGLGYLIIKKGFNNGREKRETVKETRKVP